MPVIASKHIAGTHVVHFWEPEGSKCGLPEKVRTFILCSTFIAAPSHVNANDDFENGESERKREIKNLKEKVFQIPAGSTQTTGSSRQHYAFLLI